MFGNEDKIQPEIKREQILEGQEILDILLYINSEQFHHLLMSSFAHNCI